LSGGQSPILSRPVLILGLGLVLKGAVVHNVAFLVALETFMAYGEGVNWFGIIAPVS
jgi:hypothetical protein